MKTFHQEVSLPLVAVLMAIIMALMLLGSACAMKHDSTTIETAQKKEWRAHARCRTLGKRTGDYATVLIQKNCLKNGVTTVSVLVTNVYQKGAAAAEETYKFIMEVLKFKPKMEVLVVSKHQKMPFMVFIVTGVQNE